MPVAEIITSRLLLRPLEESDADAISVLRSHPEVNRYIDRKPSTSPEEALDLIRKINANVEAGTTFYWVITESDSGRLIGTACFWNLSEDKSSGEIGFELHPDYHGKGLMKEAIPALLRFCFENTGIRQLWGVVNHQNEASIHLLRSNGFVPVPDRNGEVEGFGFYRFDATFTFSKHSGS